MYTKSKYVVGVTSDGDLEAAVGSETIKHVNLASVFVEVKSAGFCHFEPEDVKVYGESTGLRLKSNPEIDTELVGRAMAHPKYFAY